MNIGIKNVFDDSIVIAPVDNTWGLKMNDGVMFSHAGKKQLFGTVVFFDRPKITNETIIEGEILRKVDSKDLEKIALLTEKSEKALEIGQQKVLELNLPMKIMRATYAFDESEVNFFFTSEDRVDFRELVPRLAGALKTRVHLQQVGARDRAKLLGGYGICGQEQCCTRGVIREFAPITMDMARSQELIMKGPDKLSGNCGKLLCCLAYELEEYERLRVGMPMYGSRVRIAKGEGKVIGLDILNQMVKLFVEGEGVLVVPVSEVTATKTIPANEGKKFFKGKQHAAGPRESTKPFTNNTQANT